MAEWTHAICPNCWSAHYPGRAPTHVKDDDPTPCCFCGALTTSGIYVRHNPRDSVLLCKGEHPEETEESET